MPQVGSVDEIGRNLITGWAIDTDHPDRQVEVVAIANGRTVGKALTEKSRTNLLERLKAQVRPELHDQITGNYGFELALDPALSVFHEQLVEVKFADGEGTLRRNTRTLPAPRSGQMRLAPLLVVAAGRSGTTMMMQHLARHPEIVIADRYPFETKFVSYYADAFRVLMSETDRKRSLHPDAMGKNPFAIGFNPYNRRSLHSFIKTPGLVDDYFDHTMPDTLVRAFADLISGYYERVQQDQGKVSARFFAEKAAPYDTVRDGARLFAGQSHEILLVRDPRDILCSANSFWKTRKDTAIRNIAVITHRLEKAQSDGTSQTLVVRYEDMVTDQQATLDRIWRFLGVATEFGPADEQADSRLFSRHGTSKSPAASIGRWRQELSAEEIGECETVFGTFLNRFGYAAA